MTAAALFETGVHQAEVARRLGVSHQTVSRWHARWREGGREALVAGTIGRRPRLTAAQLAEIRAALDRPPSELGFDGCNWTVRSARELITQVSGVAYHPSQVWRILRQFGATGAPRRSRSRRDDSASGNGRQP